MLIGMVSSPSHLYSTSDVQVREFLWASLNTVEDDDDDGGEGDDETDTESLAMTKLVQMYNKLVDYCVTFSKQKGTRSCLRCTRIAASPSAPGTPQRKRRASACPLPVQSAPQRHSRAASLWTAALATQATSAATRRKRRRATPGARATTA